MDQEYINYLTTRLSQVNMDTSLKHEVIRALTSQRFILEDIHISAKQHGDRVSEHLSGIALGKAGYQAGDAGF